MRIIIKSSLTFAANVWVLIGLFFALRPVSLHLKEVDMWEEDDKREKRKMTRVTCPVLGSRDGLDEK